MEHDPTYDLLNLEFLPDVSGSDSVEIDWVVFDRAADRRIVAVPLGSWSRVS
jgi:hypothetical protein